MQMKINLRMELIAYDSEWIGSLLNADDGTIICSIESHTADFESQKATIRDAEEVAKLLGAELDIETDSMP